jgi:hypothetical protein
MRRTPPPWTLAPLPPWQPAHQAGQPPEQDQGERQGVISRSPSSACIPESWTIFRDKDWQSLSETESLRATTTIVSCSQQKRLLVCGRCWL